MLVFEVKVVIPNYAPRSHFDPNEDDLHPCGISGATGAVLQPDTAFGPAGVGDADELRALPKFLGSSASPRETRY